MKFNLDSAFERKRFQKKSFKRMNADDIEFARVMHLAEVKVDRDQALTRLRCM